MRATSSVVENPQICPAHLGHISYKNEYVLRTYIQYGLRILPTYQFWLHSLSVAREVGDSLRSCIPLSLALAQHACAGLFLSVRAVNMQGPGCLHPLTLMYKSPDYWSSQT